MTDRQTKPPQKGSTAVTAEKEHVTYEISNSSACFKMVFTLSQKPIIMRLFRLSVFRTFPLENSLNVRHINADPF